MMPKYFDLGGNCYSSTFKKRRQIVTTALLSEKVTDCLLDAPICIQCLHQLSKAPAVSIDNHSEMTCSINDHEAVSRILDKSRMFDLSYMRGLSVLLQLMRLSNHRVARSPSL